MNPPRLTVRMGKAFGREAFYPVDATAQVFARLARASTLTRDDLALISFLGYEILAETEFSSAPTPLRVTLRPPAASAPNPELDRQTAKT